MVRVRLLRVLQLTVTVTTHTPTDTILRTVPASIATTVFRSGVRSVAGIRARAGRTAVLSGIAGVVATTLFGRGAGRERGALASDHGGRTGPDRRDA